MKRLILLDTHAIIHRAYHALPPLTSPSGEVVGAVYGFTSILLRIFRELKPDYIAAAFDLAGPTFRHVAYERYKAQRPETPSDLTLQFSFVREILDAFGIPIIQKEGYEADDIIGTIAKKTEKEKKLKVIIVTGDADALQLVRPRVEVYSMRKGITDTVLYNDAAVRERYGLTPKELIDYKALKGDPSDNIQGVKGIGEKTAIDLIKEFGSVENLYKALKKKARPKSISESVAKKLLLGEEDAKISKELSRIHTEVPVEFSLDAAKANTLEARQDVSRVLERFGFSSLLKRVNRVKPAQKQKSAQASFFSSESESASIKSVATARDFELITEGIRAGHAGLFLANRKLYAVVRGKSEVHRIEEGVISSRGAHRAFEWSIAAYDGKRVLKYLRDYGIETTISFDILVAAYIASTGARDFSPALLLMQEFQVSGGDDPAVFGSRFFDLMDLYEKKLADGRLHEVFERIEMPLIPVLCRMEERGISLDSGFLRSLSGEVSGKIKKLEKEIFALAGEEFNIQSTQQLSKILFEKLKIKTKGLKKTEKGGKISTRESELEKLKGAHPVVENILSYRELAKLESTYIDALPALVNPKTGRIHTTFNQTGTSTGRLSSQDPNLQNIPIMSEYGKEIRKAFVASSGYILASFDYSQIELRVAAHMADDKKMIEAFRAGRDIHAATASEVFNIPLGSVTPEQRRAAKTLNFGILYGMGASALSASAGMGRDEARAFIDEYFKDFSGIARYIQETKEFAEANGYVETLFGRRRYIPEIHSSNWQVKREAERMAVNMPIQGCLPAETRILTSQGYISIGQLFSFVDKKRPKHVWDGIQWRTYQVLNRGKAELAEIKLRNGLNLKCDTRHIVLTISDSGYVWKHFRDLKKGDKVCCSLPTTLKFEPAPATGIDYRPSVHNGIPFKVKKIDRDFWYWIGYYFGDGWLETRIAKQKFVRRALKYVFGYEEQAAMKNCVEFFVSHGLKPRIRKLKPSTPNSHEKYIVSIESMGLGLLLQKIGIASARAATKRVPAKIFSESIENRKAFINGLFDADGWYGRHTRDIVTLHLCQRGLLEDVRLLLQTLGVPSKIRGPYNYKKQISYRLDIPRSFMFEMILNKPRNGMPKAGPTVPAFLVRKFIACYPHLSKKFLNHSDYIVYRRLINGGSCSLYFFDRFLRKYHLKFNIPIYDFSEVVKTDSFGKKEITFTLSVEGSHRFDSEGVISKNTATGDIVKLAMIKIDEWVRQEKLEEKVRMLLQVHDELVFEIEKKFADEAAKKIKELMEGAARLKVPLVVGVSIGPNWGK